MPGIVYVALYIDDTLMISGVEAINNTITALKEHGLVLKIMEGLQDCLSYEVKFSMNKKRAWLEQAHLIKNFSNHVKNSLSLKTPGIPRFSIIRPMNKSEKIATENQQEYWSGVGMQPGNYQKPMTVQTLQPMRNL